MANEVRDDRTAGMDRRQMLGTTTAVIGGAIAGFGSDAFAQEKPTPTPSAAAAAGPNLKPPVVQVKGGTLRGLREGKTSSFLGIRYAEAERFGPPTAVQPWTGIKNAQAWGAVCPIPEQANVGADELVFPHRYWIANEHCQYLNVWTQNLTPAVKKPVMVWMHGGGFTNGSSIEVSQAWINFARSGNPSQPGLEWKPFTKDDPQAMVFDTVSESVALRDDKLVSLLPAAGGRGGTAPTGGGTPPTGRG